MALGWAAAVLALGWAAAAARDRGQVQERCADESTCRGRGPSGPTDGARAARGMLPARGSPRVTQM